MIVEFDPTSYIFSESGVFVSITVVKRGETTQTVSVDVSTSDGTATGECLFDCNHCPIFIFSKSSLHSWTRLRSEITENNISTHGDLTNCAGVHLG